MNYLGEYISEPFTIVFGSTGDQITLQTTKIGQIGENLDHLDPPDMLKPNINYLYQLSTSRSGILG